MNTDSGMEEILPPQEDYTDGPSSAALAGAVLEYQYTKGTRYRLTFDHDFHVTFDMLDKDDWPESAGIPYRAREVRPDLILVHWIVKPDSIHVSLVVDLQEHKIHVSAMMPPNKWEFFDTAAISSITTR